MSNKHALIVAASVLASAATAQNLPLPAAPMPAPLPAGLPSGGVVSVSPAPLKHRDPSKPLTVGELADIAAQKQAEEFLARHGYTSVAPPKPAKASSAAAEPPRPVVSVRALGTWGVHGARQQAEISIGGRLMRVSGGETLAPGVKVESVSSGQVTVAVARQLRGPGARQGVEFELRTVPVGREVDIQL